MKAAEQIPRDTAVPFAVEQLRQIADLVESGKIVLTGATSRQIMKPTEYDEDGNITKQAPTGDFVFEVRYRQ